MFFPHASRPQNHSPISGERLPIAASRGTFAAPSFLAVIAIAALVFFSFPSCKKADGEASGAVSGAGSSTAGTGAGQGNGPEAARALAERGWYSAYHDAEKQKGVTLSMYGVTDSIRPVLDEFQNDTGIMIQHLTMKNGEILQRLISEQEAGVAIADIWFTGGADTFISAAQKGLLLAYRSPMGEDLDPVMKDKDGYWYGTSLTVINWIVNRDLIEKNGLKMPETWDDLLQPGLAGEVSASNPASSGTAYNIISAVLQVRGDEEGWKYLEKLIKQVPFFTPRGSDPASLVINGEAIVGINPSDGNDEIERNNPHVKIVYPADGTGWWPQPVAIVKGTKNEDAARVFIDWLLSPRGMETLARVRNAAVARKGIRIPDGIVDLGTLKLFDTDFQENAVRRDEILAEWAKRVQ